MLSFENTPRSVLRRRLKKLGWRENRKARPNVAGQIHKWICDTDREMDFGIRMKRTLRNACRIAGIAR
jgi:hypothetical protein